MFCSLWPRRSVARALPASLSRAFFLRLTPRPPTRLSCAGELVCFASECCCIGGGAAGDKFFECFHHADQCHAGTGTYVILKSSMVLVPRTRFCPVSLPAPPVEPPCILLIPSKLLYLKLGVDADDACSTYLGQVLVIREQHVCQWGSPYLDAYGEEDQDLRRGRPLYLNRSVSCSLSLPTPSLSLSVSCMLYLMCLSVCACTCTCASSVSAVQVLLAASPA